MPDGKRHCAIVLTTDLQLSGCFRRLLPKGKRHCAVALTHIKLRDLLLLLRCAFVCCSSRRIFESHGQTRHLNKDL